MIRRSLALAAASAAALIAASPALALPAGPQVAGSSTGGGPTTFQTAGSTLTVNQGAQRVVIDWASFNLAQGETVTFNQGAPNWIAFNRVGAGAPMTINGAINAPGGVWLFSPAGISFGGSANVNVGSFFASIHPATQTTTLIGGNTIALTGNTTSPPAAAINVAPGASLQATAGFLGLQAWQINQSGTVRASDGIVYLVSEGFSVGMQPSGSGITLTSSAFSLAQGRGRPAMTHTGSTTGAHVKVWGTGGYGEPGWHSVINLEGVISATGAIPGSNFEDSLVAVSVIGGALITANTGAPIPRTGTAVVNTRGGRIETTSATVAIVGQQLEIGSIASGDRIFMRSPDGDVTIGGPVRAQDFIRLDVGRYLTVEAGGEVAGGLGRTQPALSSWQYFSDEIDAGIQFYAQDVALNGILRTGAASGVDGIEIRPRNSQGAYVLGGADVPLSSSFHLSNNEFQRLQSPWILISPWKPDDGSALPPPTPGRIEDLTVNTSFVERLLVATWGADLAVVGDISPTSPNRAWFSIGGVSEGEAPGVWDGHIPENVLISGRIGATNPLLRVDILANQEILIGSPAFIAAAAADSNFSAAARSGDFAPPAPGWTWIAADRLQIAAMGRVLQQNTAPGGGFGGLRIGAPPAGGETLFEPNQLRGAILEEGDFVPAYQEGPTRVELFGTFVGGPGKPSVATLFVEPGLAAQADWQINGCNLTGTCSFPAVDATRVEAPVIVTVQDLAPPDEAPAASEQVITGVPFAFARKAEEEEEERDEDVAGSGNPDLWPITPGGLR